MRGNEKQLVALVQIGKKEGRSGSWKQKIYRAGEDAKTVQQRMDQSRAGISPR